MNKSRLILKRDLGKKREIRPRIVRKDFELNRLMSKMDVKFEMRLRSRIVEITVSALTKIKNEGGDKNGTSVSK